MKPNRIIPRLFFLTFSLFMAHFPASSQNPETYLPWNLVWNDEFDNPGTMITKWCRNDWRAPLYGRNDLNAFRTEPSAPPDNIELRNENNGATQYLTQIVRLEDRTRWSNLVNTSHWELHTYHYTAPSWMVSKQRFRYGYFEIRCRLPLLGSFENNKGIGANFWLYGESPTPSGMPKSEIDIFEFVSGPNPHTQTSNVHHLVDGFNHGYHHYRHDEPSPDFHDWHTFGAWWGPDFVKFYLDGRLYLEARDSIKMIADEMIPIPIVIDFNVFTLSEQPDPRTHLPYEYDIDYVRVYQLNTDRCNTDFVNCSPIPAQSSVYRDIRIGGGCIYPNGNSKSLTARNSIIIEPGFEAELGSELSLSIYPYCHTSTVTPNNCN